MASSLVGAMMSIMGLPFLAPPSVSTRCLRWARAGMENASVFPATEMVRIKEKLKEGELKFQFQVVQSKILRMHNLNS